MMVMPEGLAGTAQVLSWIARELGQDCYVNIMSQYHPAGRVDHDHYGRIARCVTRQEMEDAFTVAAACGLRRVDVIN